MTHLLIYKDNNEVMAKGSKLDMLKLLQGTYKDCRSHYKILTKQQYLETKWDF